MTVWIPIVSEIADLVFLLLAAAIAVASLLRSPLKPGQRGLLAGAMVFSLLAKVALASQGQNFDVTSYRLVSNIQELGQSVYANTERYNYGPIWAWIVAGFGHLAGPGTGGLFHMWIAGFLAMVDVLIAVAAARAYSWMAALIFLLSPIGLLISGFHSQFDNLAVLMGLSAWLLIRAGKPKTPAFLLSAVCLGVSLIVKHILFLFPVWMVFWKPLGKLRNRILYALIAYGLFAIGFLPWCFDPASRAGIRRNVFGYNSSLGFSWIGYIIDLFRPLSPSPIAPTLQTASWSPWVKILWIVLMVAVGAVLVRKGVRELYLFYLLALYASSPALTTQYEAIPLLAAAVFYSVSASWSFQISGTLAIFTSRTNIGRFLQTAILYLAIPPIMIAGRPLFLGELVDLIWTFTMCASQFCAGVLLVRLLRAQDAAPSAQSLPRRIWLTVSPIALGGVPAVIRIARIVLAR
jgi:hypothetical protein